MSKFLANLRIVGETSNSATYAIQAQNDSLSNLFRVRNDGQVVASTTSKFIIEGDALTINGLFAIYSGAAGSFEATNIGVGSDISLNGVIKFKTSIFTTISGGNPNQIDYTSKFGHRFINYGGAAITNPLVEINHGDTGDTQPLLKIVKQSNLRFQVSDTGLTGIRVVPTATLHAHGLAATPQLQIEDDSANVSMFISYAGTTALGSNNTAGTVYTNPKLILNTGSGTPGLMHYNSFGVELITFTNVGDSIFGNASNHDLAFITNDVERIKITAAGNVGINHLVPPARLTVVGSGITSATTSFLVADSASTTYFSIKDNGAVSTTLGLWIDDVKKLWTDSLLNTVFWNHGSASPLNLGTGSRNTIIGNSDSSQPQFTTGGFNTVLGTFSGMNITSGAFNLVLGNYNINTPSTGSYNINNGVGGMLDPTANQTLTFNGYSENSNEVVFGSEVYTRYTNWWFGQGKQLNNSYGSFNMNWNATSSKTGETNISARVPVWNFNASQGTGTGIGGDFVWNVSPAGVSGSALNALVEALRIKQSGVINVSNLAGVGTRVVNVDASGNLVPGVSAGSALDGSGTANYIPKWVDANTLTDGTWAFNGNDIFPTVSGSNIGSIVSPEFRVGTIYMGSIIDYSNNLKFDSLGSTKMTMTTAGNFGIANITPSARLHINAVGNTASDIAIKIQNLAASNLYNVGGSGEHRFNSYFDGGGSGIPNYQFESSSGNLIKIKSSAGAIINWEETSGINGSLSNAGGYAQILFQNRFTLKDWGGTSKLWMDSVDGHIGIGYNYFAAAAQLHVIGDTTLTNEALHIGGGVSSDILVAKNSGNIGIGLAAPSAKLEIKGVDDLIGNFGLKVNNNTGAPVLHVRNDGSVGVGGTSIYSTYALQVITTGANKGIQLIGNGVGTAVLESDTDGSSGSLKLYSLPIGNQAIQLNSLSHSFINTGYNFGIDIAPTAKLHIKGSGSSSATYSLKVENSLSSISLQVDDAGHVGIGSTPSASYKVYVDGTGGTFNGLIVNNDYDRAIVGQVITNPGLIAVQGIANTGGSGIGVQGITSNGYGIYGEASSGVAAYGYASNATGGAIAGLFEVHDSGGFGGIILKGLGDAGVERFRVNETGAWGIGTTPNISAIFDIVSTAKGFMIPRMTTSQKNAIATPATSLMVFDTTLNAYYWYNGTAWVAFGGGGISGSGTDNYYSKWTSGGTALTDSLIHDNAVDITVDTFTGVGDRMVEASPAGIITATRNILTTYGVPNTEKLKLESVTNWSGLGVYIGTAITGTYQGQKHYDANYLFEAVADNLFIRLIRG